MESRKDKLEKLEDIATDKLEIAIECGDNESIQTLTNLLEFLSYRLFNIDY